MDEIVVVSVISTADLSRGSYNGLDHHTVLAARHDGLVGGQKTRP